MSQQADSQDSQDAQPTPAEQPQPTDAAHAGTPHYGTFGDPANVPATPEHHPARQYVGGYMDPDGTHGGCETGPYDPSEQRGHAEQNQATEAVRATQGQDDDVTNEAFCEDDLRNAGGQPFDPQQQDWQGL